MKNLLAYNLDCVESTVEFQLADQLFKVTHTHNRLTAFCPGLPG